ncbi:TLR adapter interacting with SLC15A4 on the lysosome isoform X2 [Paramormyrops kingsleyae]|uniref:TLR adapter interacting with SLC15A4 on the lysosome isoform X2 n=1 Tax=Paramormyrops kingsleyae TaxID=1676925 RepID=UPI000CD5E820|nr:uncharacterized protein CXorf21 homolog isoform X2 [Paramormyrops kingsleyae]
MLSESFLSVLRYKKEVVDRTPPSPSIRGQDKPPGMSKVVENLSSKVLAQPSPTLSIPGTEGHPYCGLELYRSWCCPSFCKDYPDLQLGGDLIGDKASESPILDDKAYGGPFLKSEDLAEMAPLLLEPIFLDPQCDVAPPAGEAADSSIILSGEPQSDSMLNSYLENKQLEVYLQHLQDMLARGGSSPSMLPPSLASPNLAPSTPALSSPLQFNQPQSTEPSAVGPLTSQSNTAVSSHFSSPMLRISNSDPGKRQPPLCHYDLQAPCSTKPGQNPNPRKSYFWNSRTRTMNSRARKVGREIDTVLYEWSVLPTAGTTYSSLN